MKAGSSLMNKIKSYTPKTDLSIKSYQSITTAINNKLIKNNK